MRTTDLFKFNRSSKRLNESLEKTFGAKINFAEFDTTKLEDARNKLRTQIYDARSQTGFNEELENDTLSKAQFMHDAIVAELTDREEHIVDTTQTEGFGSLEDEVVSLLKRFDENANEIGGYGDPDVSKIIALLKQGNAEAAAEEVWDSYADQDGGEIRGIEPYIEDLQAEFEVLTQGGDESIETEAGRDAYQRDYDSSVSGMGRQERDWDEGDTEPANNFAVAINGKQWKVFKGRGRHADDMAERQHLRQLQDWAAKKSEATGKKWSVHVTGEPATESTNNESNESMDNDPRVENAKNVVARWAQQNGVKNNVLAAMNKAAENDQLQHSEYIALDILDPIKKRSDEDSNQVDYSEDDEGNGVWSYKGHTLTLQGDYSQGEMFINNKFVGQYETSSSGTRKFYDASMKPMFVSSVDDDSKIAEFLKSKAEMGKESIQAEKFDPLKHVKNPTQGEKDAAKDVKRGTL
jgi:hypothetical protein